MKKRGAPQCFISLLLDLLYNFHVVQTFSFYSSRHQSVRSSREADRQIWWDRDPADGKKEDSEKIRRKKNVFPFSFGIFPIKFSCLLFFLPYFWPSFDAAINWIQFFRHSLYVSGKDKKTFETCARFGGEPNYVEGINGWALFAAGSSLFIFYLSLWPPYLSPLK